MGVRAWGRTGAGGTSAVAEAAFPTAWEARADTGPDGHGAPERLVRTHEHALPRPALPAALICLPAAWAGVELAFTHDVAAYFRGAQDAWPLAWALLALLAGALLAVAARHTSRAGLVAAVAFALAAGLACAHVRAGGIVQAAGHMAAQPASACEFVLATDATPSSLGGMQAQADVYVTSAGGTRRVGSAWLKLPASAGTEGLYAGAHLAVVGRWSAVTDDDWGRSLIRRGMGASVTATRVRRLGFGDGPLGTLRRARAGMLDSLDESDAGTALVAGVVLGHQAGFSALEAHEWFSNLGLAHLVAVSGSHLAVVAGLFASALARTRARPAARLALTACALTAYVTLTGVQPSAVRALVMVLAALSGRLAGRRSHALSGLGVAALGMLLLDPTLAHKLGFQLSVASVLGIALFGRLAGRWAAAALPARVPAGVGEAVAVTLVAQTCTLPLTLPAFGVLPVLSPMANVLVGPVVSALLTVGVVAVPLGSLVPALAGPAASLTSALGTAACAIARVLADVPYAAVPLSAQPAACAGACCALALAAYVAWPQPTPARARACAPALAAVVVLTLGFWRLAGPARICVLDVGQGDAILVQQGPHAVLVDTGPGDAVVQALGRQHVIHLDAVLLTHTDADHASGLEHLRGLVQVDEVIVGEGVQEIARSDKPELARAMDAVSRRGVRTVLAGDVIRAGALELDVVWPNAPVTEESNATSVVCVARCERGGDALSALLTGDAESEQVEPLARSGAAGNVDVLKVGHHGSAVSTTPAMLEELRPALAVISAGEGNRYGHPTQVCLQALEDAGVPELCTIEHGDLDLRPARDGPSVRTQR